jgi:hypothetical protein
MMVKKPLVHQRIKKRVKRRQREEKRKIESDEMERYLVRARCSDLYRVISDA